MDVDDQGDDGWELIERTRSGDAAAFGRFFDQHFTEVYRFVFAFVRHQPTAEDLTADAFFRALRTVATVRRRHGSSRDWLLAIALGAVRDHYCASEARRSGQSQEKPDEPGRSRSVVLSLRHRAIAPLRALLRLLTSAEQPRQSRGGPSQDGGA